MDGRKLDVLFDTFFEITSLAHAGEDTEPVYAGVLRCCCEMLDADQAVFMQVKDGRIERIERNRGEVGALRRTEFEATPAICAWLERECRPFVGPAGDWRLPAEPGLLAQRSGAAVCAPLVGQGPALGALVARRVAKPRGFGADDLRLLTVLANQTAVVLENIRLYEQLKQEAVIDGLTGIYNYRSLMRALRQEVQRSTRHGNKFVFVMADVDHLKNYNERFGHIAGSQVLAEIASLLLGNCRSTDIVGKYGGDEFGLVLPQTGTPGARVLVDRMREAIAAHAFQHLQPGEITCSFGVAAYPQDGQQARDLVRVADALLFRAKRAGKNTVLTALDVAHDDVPRQETADAP